MEECLGLSTAEALPIAQPLAHPGGWRQAVHPLTRPLPGQAIWGGLGARRGRTCTPQVARIADPPRRLVDCNMQKRTASKTARGAAPHPAGAEGP
jgi:hypothetical protein